MGGRGDWGVAASSLTLPPFAGPTDAAIVIGPDLPQCMQANYASAVFFRPLNTTAPQRTPIRFEAQRKNLVAPSTQTVDHGWLINDGVNCGYVVYHRSAALNSGASGTGPLLIQETWSDVIETVGGVVVTGIQFQWRGNTDVFLLSPAEFFAYGDQLSLRNDSNSGAANANSSTNSAAFANYPTNVSCSIAKVGAAGNTDLLVDYGQTFYVDNTNTGPKFAVNDGTTDWPTHQVAPTVPATFARMSSSGVARLVGLAAGSYTITPRWARYGGTGSVFSAVNDDWTTLKVFEVAS